MERKIFIIGIFISLSCFNLLYGEEEPDIKLPAITIIGKDRSKAEEGKKSKKQPIKIKKLPKLEKEMVEDKIGEIELPKIEEGNRFLKRKKYTSSFTIKGGNYNSLIYQYLYGEKFKDSNILFMARRSKSKGFLIDNYNYNKYSDDEISLSIENPLSLPISSKKIFLYSELKYTEKENMIELPSLKDREYFKDLSLSLKNRNLNLFNSQINISFFNSLSRLEYEKIKKVENNTTDLNIYLSTNLKRKGNILPLNFNLRMRREKQEEEEYNFQLSGFINNLKIKKYNFNLSLSYHNFEKISFLGYKIDLFYPYEKDIIFFTNIERKIDKPTFKEVYGRESYIEEGDFQSQKQNSVNLGFKYQISKDTFLSSYLFYQKISDLLSFTDKDKDYLYEPYNISTADISGIKFKIKRRINPTIILKGELKYLFSFRDIKSLENLPFIPQKELDIGLKLEDIKGFDIEFTGAYRGNIYAQDNLKLNDYTLLNLNLYKWIKKDLRLFISLENLLNQKYQKRPNYYGNLATIYAGLIIKL